MISKSECEIILDSGFYNRVLLTQTLSIMVFDWNGFTVIMGMFIPFGIEIYMSQEYLFRILETTKKNRVKTCLQN